LDSWSFGKRWSRYWILGLSERDGIGFLVLSHSFAAELLFHAQVTSSVHLIITYLQAVGTCMIPRFLVLDRFYLLPLFSGGGSFAVGRFPLVRYIFGRVDVYILARPNTRARHVRHTEELNASPPTPSQLSRFQILARPISVMVFSRPTNALSEGTL
jgi:hypothetical protein